MRRLLEVVATTLFQRDSSSGRLLFLGCLAVIATTHIDPESAARPPAVVAFFGWMGVTSCSATSACGPSSVAARTTRHERFDLSGQGPPRG